MLRQLRHTKFRKVHYPTLRMGSYALVFVVYYPCKNNIYIRLLKGNGCVEAVDACETSEIPLFRESHPSSSAGASFAPLSGTLFVFLYLSVYIDFFLKPRDSCCNHQLWMKKKRKKIN